MSFTERLGLRKPDKIISSPQPTRRHEMFPEIPRAEGDKRRHLETEIEKLLRRDLSTATFNRYVDAMIELLGVKFVNASGSKSAFLWIPENDHGRTLQFTAKPDGNKTIGVTFENPEGRGRAFRARHEEVSVSEAVAAYATEDDHSFANHLIYFDIPYNFAQEVPSFVAEKPVEIEFERETNMSLTLGETKNFLVKAFDLYKQNPPENSKVYA